MVGRLPVSSRIDFEPPLLAVGMKGLTILQMQKGISLVVELIGVVDVLRIDFIAKLAKMYSVVKDFLLKSNSPRSLYYSIVCSRRENISSWPLSSMSYSIWLSALTLVDTYSSLSSLSSRISAMSSFNRFNLAIRLSLVLTSSRMLQPSLSASSYNLRLISQQYSSSRFLHHLSQLLSTYCSKLSCCRRVLSFRMHSQTVTRYSRNFPLGSSSQIFPRGSKVCPLCQIFIRAYFLLDNSAVRAYGHGAVDALVLQGQFMDFAIFESPYSCWLDVLYGRGLTCLSYAMSRVQSASSGRIWLQEGQE